MKTIKIKNKKDWKEFKAMLNPCDIIFVHTKELFDFAGMLVQFGTGYFAHTEIIRDNGITLRADGKIVRWAKVDDYYKDVLKKKRELVIGRLKRLNNVDIDSIFKEMHNQAGKKYDMSQIVGLGIYSLIGKLGHIGQAINYALMRFVPNPLGQKKELICSESVVKCCRAPKIGRKQKYPVCKGIPLQNITPTMVSKDKNISLILKVV